jgi:hypothetical protein
MANGHGGRRAGAGRKPGSANRKTRELADQAAIEGITPLEVKLQTMRMLWARAHEGSVPDLDLAKQACAIAAQAAPYCHPRLAAIEAKVDTTGQVEVKLTRAELDERARRHIAEAFREYLPPGHEEARTNGPVIEHRSSPLQDGDRSEPVAEADHPALPVPRDFARPSSFGVVPGVARRSRPRRPRPVPSGWAG